MDALHHLALFAGGLFLMNALPHLVAGALGRPFQTPFASPPGIGLSSATVNVLWGFVNLVVAWWLLARVASADLREWDRALAVGAGVLLMALFHARHFGRLHGGDRPRDGDR